MGQHRGWELWSGDSGVWRWREGQEQIDAGGADDEVGPPAASKSGPGAAVPRASPRDTAEAAAAPGGGEPQGAPVL